MPLERTVAGTRVTIYHPVVLAIGESLAVTVVLPEGPTPPRSVVEAVTSYLAGDDNALESLDTLDAALAYSILYGGLQVIALTGRPAPLARLHIDARILLGDPCEKGSKVDDNLILEAYTRMYHGDEIGGLRMLEGCSVYPTVQQWRSAGGLEVLPLGYRSYPANP